MKMPLRPTPLNDLLEKIDTRKLPALLDAGSFGHPQTNRYPHWDKLRHLKPPPGLTTEEWWTGIKLARGLLYQPLPVLDISGRPFRYAMPDAVLEAVHKIDRDASGRIEVSEQVTNPNTRDRYIISSLVEEAITSSQLEGASTTREQAKDMIRTGRRPIDRSEQMILNNFEAMRFVRTLKSSKLERRHILALHEIVTEYTLDDPSAAGRLRKPDEKIHVVDPYTGTIFHTPPPASQLDERLDRFCAFANCELAPERFVHPIIRAITVHFALAYDHPFVDGNGRTARALFYWSMLSQGYWLCEFLSISRILRAAPSKYARSFLYTETDDSDLTYFILYQLGVIQRSIRELHTYIDRKTQEYRETETLVRDSDLNHRQIALMSHALKHPDARYTIESHQTSHGVAYQTARTDLLRLAEVGFLRSRKVGRAYHFKPAADLSDKLRAYDNHPKAD